MSLRHTRRSVLAAGVGGLVSACTKPEIVSKARAADKAPAVTAKDQPLRPAAPAIIAARYQASFVEEFTNRDLRRFSEAGTFSVEGAPAWRSRYRHPRKDVINQEKQIYVDRKYAGTGEKALGINPFLFSKKHGTFSIIAERTRPEHKPFLYDMGYTSGCITTEMSHSQQYGFFEMRARFPLGRSFWPTFWLMPVRQAWPPEIDIIEASGDRPTKGHFAVRNPGDKKGFASDWMEVGRIDTFRTWQCEWTKDVIAFYIDGKKYWERRGHKVHEPMYLLANMAMGSHDKYWIPNPDSSTPLPARMEIDYIRAFKK